MQSRHSIVIQEASSLDTQSSSKTRAGFFEIRPFPFTTTYSINACLQDSKPLQVDAVSTPNRHPIGNQVSSRYDLFYLQPHTLVCRTVNLYRLMQSRHSIVIQEAIRFPRDTAFSIYNYIFDQRLFAGQ
ncbi:hypothetical protein J6590_095819 [Homalodisca vitripennis]|nr:hypothetical protein J6590_095819 [Homalodisca vitripennis]